MITFLVVVALLGAVLAAFTVVTPMFTRTREIGARSASVQVYEWWTGCPNCDDQAERVYVGISDNAGRRSGEHAEGTLERILQARSLHMISDPYPTRRSAKIEETKRIKRFRWPYNKQENMRVYRQSGQIRQRLERIEGEPVSIASQVEALNGYAQRALTIGGIGTAGFIILRFVEAMLF